LQEHGEEDFHTADWLTLMSCALFATASCKGFIPQCWNCNIFSPVFLCYFVLCHFFLPVGEPVSPTAGHSHGVHAFAPDAKLQQQQQHRLQQQGSPD